MVARIVSETGCLARPRDLAWQVERRVVDASFRPRDLVPLRIVGVLECIDRCGGVDARVVVPLWPNCSCVRCPSTCHAAAFHESGACGSLLVTLLCAPILSKPNETSKRSVPTAGYLSDVTRPVSSSAASTAYSLPSMCQRVSSGL